MNFGTTRSGLHRNALVISIGITIAGLICLELAFGQTVSIERHIRTTANSTAKSPNGERIAHNGNRHAAMPILHIHSMRLVDEIY